MSAALAALFASADIVDARLRRVGPGGAWAAIAHASDGRCAGTSADEPDAALERACELLRTEGWARR